MHRGRLSTALRCDTCGAGPGQPCTFVGGALISAAAFSILLAACGGSKPQLEPVDVEAIQAASRLCAFAYGHNPDGGPISADTRACYCGLHGVLVRQHLDAYDAGFPCQ